MTLTNIERVEELRLGKDREKAISDLLDDSFSVDFEGRSFFQNRHHCRFLCWDGSCLAGHLAVAFRAIQLGNERVDIIGIGEVVVAADQRKRGIGSDLIQAALEEGRHAGADFAVLFGEASIYSKAGFVSAPNRITLSKMEGARTDAIVREIHPFLLVRPLGGKPWNPEAPVDLAGFPF